MSIFKNLILALVCLWAWPVSAKTKIETPTQMIKALYDPYLHPSDAPEPVASDESEEGPWEANFFEPKLYAAYHKARTEDEPDTQMPLLDWDVFATGNDVSLSALSLKTRVISSKRQDVTARFLNFKTRVSITYQFHMTAQGWRVFDMVYAPSKDNPKSMSLRAHLKRYGALRP